MKALFEKEKAFWSSKFDADDQIVTLPYNRTSTISRNTDSYHSISITLPPQIFQRISSIAGGSHLAIFMVLLAGIETLLSKYTSQETIIVGVPGIRTSNDAQPLSNQLLFLKNEVHSKNTFKSLLNQMKSSISEAMKQQSLPFWNFIDNLNVHYDSNRVPIINTIVSLKEIHPLDFEEHAAFDIHFQFDLENGSLQLNTIYNVNRYDHELITQVGRHLSHILSIVLFDLDLSLELVDLLSEDEQEQLLLTFNNTTTTYPREKTIQQLFEEQVERTPDQVAIVLDDKQLTYKELNERANQLARTLRNKGVTTGQLVGLMVERSLEMIIGIFGILKAGGAYVPIDPEYPNDRIRYMLEDSGAKVFVLQSHLQQRADFEGTCILLDDSEAYSEDSSNLEPVAEATDVAYVIYTSGSTGTPKGTQIRHLSATRVVMKTNYIEISEEDTLLQLSNYVFDGSVFDIYGALLHGAKLILIKKTDMLDLHKLSSVIEQQNVTVFYIPTAFFNTLIDNQLTCFQNIRKVLFGGERASVSHIRKAFHYLGPERLIHVYGPTESTVFTTFYPINSSIEEDVATVPIGKPLANTLVYIVDQFNNLKPIGVPGELCIAGEGLSKGYLNREELTGEKFVDNPFVPGTQMYRTGDLVKMLPDGNIDFLDRIDKQVKIRGFRIELGEIENALLTFPEINEAIVVDGIKDGNKYLAAYYVAKEPIEAKELLKNLSAKLPEYMVPDYCISLDQMPLTPNGKIDRKMLPAVEESLPMEEYVAPRTLLEEKLEDIWKGILGLSQVGIKDNFFERGGHSLRATALVSTIQKELQKNIQLRDVFQHPTIEQMAQIIENMEQTAYSIIPIMEEKPYYPVSSAQKRLYILGQLAGGEISYNMPSALILDGVIDRERIEKAFQQLIARHEILRTSFELVNGEPIQRVHKEVPFAMEYVQVANEEAAEGIIRDFTRMFDLQSAPLLRVGLVQLAEDRHILLFDMHHIISDGTSMNVLIQEFASLYEEEVLPKQRIQYKDYASWQQQQIKSEWYQQQENYWLQAFSGELPVLQIPTDYIRPAIRSFEGSLLEFRIGKRTSEELKQLAAETGSTLYMVLLTIYTTLLGKYSGQEDIIVGTPIAGRPHADLESMIGMFVNTLAIRNYPRGEKTFYEYLQEVKETSLKAYENQDYLFEELVDKLDVNRDMSRNPLFDTMFVLQNLESKEQELEGLRITPYASEHTISKFDLTLHAMEDADTILCSFEYATTLFKRETIERMAKHFIQLIDGLLSNPHAKLSTIEMMTMQEKTLILETFNNTTVEDVGEQTIHQLFEMQVERTPNRVAVVYEGEQLTYCELNERANQLARTLRAEGIGSDQLVGILVEHSLDMMVGLLGILKAGGAYVPIDPDYPEDRIQYLLEDSQTSILLTQQKFSDKLPYNKKILYVDNQELYQGSTANLEHVNSMSDLAYIIYTSGSTGNPKGAMITHQGLVNYIWWATKVYVQNETVHFPLYSSISFDLTVTSIYTPLISGNTIYIYRGEDKVQVIQDILADNKVGIMKLTPTHLKLIEEFDGSNSNIKRFIVGGENLHTQLASKIDRNFGGNVQIMNEYGPTETVVGCMLYVFDPNHASQHSVPIGVPADNVRIYLLDKALQPVPIGSIGEMYIAGDGVARGYLNRPELTAEKFIENPFKPGERMYRTGDLARWLPDGNMEYVGRTDDQVKIRGYRIELGEIEAQLVNVEEVQEAVVIAQEDHAGLQHLCAYIVAEKQLTMSELKSRLAHQLPSYMVPSYFIQLDKIPHTPNGKLDRKALPAPEDSTIQTGAEYVPPRTWMESKLVQIWKEVLGLSVIGVKDNFFDIGGHSLRATHLVSKIYKELNQNLPLRDVFQYPTIEQMAEILIGREKIAYTSIPIIEERAYYPVSSAQKRLYILSQLIGGEISYNMPDVVKIDGELDKERLEIAFRKLISRHETLRTSFELVNGEPIQRVHQNVDFAIEYAQANEEELEAYIQGFVRPFDLEQAPLLRVGLVEKEKDRHILMFDMHHIISDGVSLGILIQEFISLYGGEELSPLRIQYKDYAIWQREGVQSEEIKRQEAYWLEVFHGEIPVLDLPTDYVRPAMQSFEGSTLEFVIDQKSRDGLRQIAAQTGSTLYMVLLAAYSTLLHKYTGQEDVIVGTPIAGRSHPDLEPIIGMFVNTLSIRTYPVGEKTFYEFVQEVKDTALGAYENQNYPFEELVDKLDVNRDLSRNPLFDTMFELKNLEQEELGVEGLQLSPYVDDHAVSKFDLSWNAMEESERIVCLVEYATSLYKKETVERMGLHFIQLIEEIVNDPHAMLSSLGMITHHEKEQILKEFNGTASDYVADQTIQQIFESQVERIPDQMAVVFEDKHLTYRQLNERANQLARTLRTEGVQPDQLVGIMVERSLEMMVGIFAILKAGAAYVPIDPNFPEERITYMLEDAGAKLLLVQSYLQDRVAFPGRKVMLDDCNSYNENASNLEAIQGPNHLAYVIYTSGTTGKPKGVMIEHGQVTAMAHAWKVAYGLDEECPKVLQWASFSFDVFTGDYVRALLHGGQLIICPSQSRLDPARICELVNVNRVNIFESTPAIVNHLMEYIYENNVELPSLKTLILGSDQCSPDAFAQLLDRFGSQMRILNSYGVTEACIDSSFFENTEFLTTMNLPIGKPLPNVKMYVLNAQGALQPVGIPGELYIGGIGVGRGYLNRPEMTAEKFITNPFTNQERMYKTGDLVKWLPDGNIEYLGRIDHQVKIRGNRIELGEVEAQLLKVKHIQEAVVVAREEATGQKLLCAYFIADQPLLVSDVRSTLLQELPGYMIPSYFVQLEQMPLSPNGKIDRKALPAPEGKLQTGVEHLAPRTQTEVQIASIWQEVLGIPSIGVRDNFFDSGGHSLRATTLVAKMHKEMGINFPLRDVFEYPTIEQMAKRVSELDHVAHFSIPVIPESEFYPVSSSQKRLYILNQIEGGGLIYNMPTVLMVEGQLHWKNLEEAFQKMISRHEILRTGFKMINGEPVQHIYRDVTFEIEYAQAKEEETASIIQAFVREFDLAEAPLLRVGLIELEADRHILMIDTHHIISDAASSSIFVQELVQLYKGEELEPLRIQYKDYAVWQQEEVHSERMRNQEAYWLDTHQNEIPVLDLPTDYPRPALQSYQGDVFEFVIDQRRSDGLRQIAAQTGSTLFMVLLAAYTTLLSKNSGQEDIIVGTPIAGRPYADLEGLIGMFINTLAIRTQPMAEKIFYEYVKEVKEHALQAYENQEYPFEELVEKLQVARDFSRNPLFDTMFVLQNVEQGDQTIEGLQLRPYGGEHTVSKFDLSLYADEDGKNIVCTFEFATSLFKRDTIKRMSEHFLQVIDSIVADPNTKLSTIEIITLQEKELLLQTFNDTVENYPREKTIYQLFESQVERTPEQVAVVYEDEQLTYRELNEQANQLARTLRAEGVGANQLVGIMVDRSLDMMIGLMGILKSGGAYVPIDPDYPDERIRYMLEDSKANLVVTQSHLQERISFAGRLIPMDKESAFHHERSNLESISGPTDLAYVIYTSGSTGKPKGVMILQHAVVNLLQGITNQIDFTQGKSLLSVTTISFDIFVLETLLSLSKGVRVVLASSLQQTDPRALRDVIQKQQVDMIQMTPSRMQMLLSSEYIHCLQGLQEIMLGGEALPAFLIKTLHENTQARLYNMYGPTETTVWSSVGELIEGAPITIGKPLVNTSFYILNAENHIQPIGIAGELCIAGEGLAKGYWNRPELTTEKFVENPFVTGEKMYRTGDLARWLPDGTIEYLGRIDHQVKIRGYRIELGEIESLLLQIPSVQEAVVIAREEQVGQKQLCAYVVANQQLTVGEIRSSLSQDLPTYMIPSFFIQLEQMPLTPNGKINRNVLPIPEGNICLGVEYIAPQTPTEVQLVDIWQEVLGVTKIGKKDNFFELGGHSLHVLELIRKIYTDIRVEIPIRVVFEMPTVEAMAEEIVRSMFAKNNSKPITKLNEHGCLNVFCFPPAIGYGMAYIEMAKLLEHHCILYGIDFIEEYNNDEEIMEQYVKILTDVQGSQPYVFLGYSIGGNLAFEVAKAMELKGYEVKDIIMLDSILSKREAESSKEDALQEIDFLLEDTPEQYKHLVTPTYTNRIYSYARYRNQLVNEGTVQANIHELVASDSTRIGPTVESPWSWEHATLGNHIQYQARGTHEEMLDPEMIEDNTRIVRLILQKIIDEAYAVSSYATNRFR
ncbi:non-ribosomal peptide synthetase [Brevibacillus laterosporus]|uniref:non-ribosomal peptide synthetase n=1 Tax=Brevibacillus laterosporus TaxID=1465 RepID=UPI0018CC87AD|nr:non-ribosomal peptide synthetase [Brevibacillus laterosporus]MED1910401.1 non-ribosomal peptide synthetase [Brevibacillus laterosporus]